MTPRLLLIELKKMTNYRAFWVMLGLYVLLLEVVVSGGMKFSEWLESVTTIEAGNIEIPLYNFPSIWGNIAYISGIFKIVLGFIVITGIANEFTYRTARQNIIDGLSKEEFMGSKILTNLLLSAGSAVLVFCTTLYLGSTHGPDAATVGRFTGSGIIFAYWLEVFGFLSVALFWGMWVPRTGLAILLLIVSPTIETIIAALFNYTEQITPYLPLRAMSKLVEMPFFKSGLSAEPPDGPDALSVIIVLAWVIAFNYAAYLKLKKTDL